MRWSPARRAGVDAGHNGIMDDAWKLFQNRSESQVLASGATPKRVCGTAQAHATLQQGRSGDKNADPYRVPLNENVPTLSEMTRGALNVLDNDRDGFSSWSREARSIGPATTTRAVV